MGSSVSHETFLSTNKDSKDGLAYSAKFERNFFAEGACRYAFKGVLSGNGPRNEQKCVTKVFKKEFAKNFVMWAPDLAASKKAQEFSKEFLTRCSSQIQIEESEIEFLIPLISRMKNLSAFKLLGLFTIKEDVRFIKMNNYVAIEPFIEGQYEKFNSNGGYEQEFHQMMTAFCHWTWYISGHQFMVCDLQGVKTGKKYILTDPAIHSYDRRFGDTDLGVAGMELVLGNHICNTICSMLGLNNPMTGFHVRSGPRSTTYSFQVTEEELLKARSGKSEYFQVLDAKKKKKKE